MDLLAEAFEADWRPEIHPSTASPLYRELCLEYTKAVAASLVAYAAEKEHLPAQPPNGATFLPGHFVAKHDGRDVECVTQLPRSTAPEGGWGETRSLLFLFRSKAKGGRWGQCRVIWNGPRNWGVQAMSHVAPERAL